MILRVLIIVTRSTVDLTSHCSVVSGKDIEPVLTMALEKAFRELAWNVFRKRPSEITVELGKASKRSSK